MEKNFRKIHRRKSRLISVVNLTKANFKGKFLLKTWQKKVFQETKVDYDNVIVKILAVSKNRTDTRIYVRGDKTINYGRVLEVMGMLSGSGFTKVALISEPYKER